MSDPECWVLLRGLGREARHWGGFVQRLGEALNTRSILTPDLPGNGLRYRERSPCSIAQQVEALRRCLALDGPVHIIALSLGGMLALEWASRYPAEIKSLVLINSSLSALSPFWQRLRARQYGPLLRLLWLSLPARERLLLEVTVNDPALARTTQADWIRWQQQSPVSRLNLLRQLIAAARYRAPQPWPVCPALVLNCPRDRLVDARCSRAIAGHALWPLRSHGHAGHDLPLEAPDWLAEQIADWHFALRFD